ncbi:MAG: saccharopine dehydrogenase NADP-binding domain-containing protein [Bacteroidales bacterium]|nr:saccharopine dehydrogenase NADP-binding domain-containing protein [Bacteroidales bacterium]
MNPKIVVLGAGLVGNAIAIDLSKNYNVTSVDIHEDALQKLSKTHNIQTLNADLSMGGIVQTIVKNFDLVIGALPGFMGFETAKQVIEAGKNMVDISFFPENPFKLDKLAKEKNVTIVTDCGVAPGMGNIILGYHNEKMEVKNYKCFVGGLPFKREWPYEYKAVFSPIDVIEEYTRPARYVEGERLIIKEALSDTEHIDFEEIGTLEAWNSDGLRTLIETMNIPNMIEKTLRYPGTIEYIKVLRESGFFSYDEINVNGKKIRPIDLTAKLLTDKWKLKPRERDFTVMRIFIHGLENSIEKTYSYNLFDKYDKKTNTISMARTTGYTCTAVANLILNGNFNKKGICPPEYLGVNEENFNFIINYLKDRGVIYRVKSE